jgi:hypothetical protein
VTGPRAARIASLVVLGLYGASTLATGVVLATAAEPPGGPAARTVALAPVLPPAASPSGGTAPAPPATVATARVGRSAPVAAAFRPRLLALPGGAVAPVQASGVHADGALVIPDDPATVGWWDGGALAGEPYGSVVLAGHVDSARYGIGVMARLRTLAAGDVVEVRDGERRLRYRVTGRRSLPQAELAARSDAFRQDVAGRLVLITCGGAFDPVRHRYQENLVVYASPLPSPHP